MKKIFFALTFIVLIFTFNACNENSEIVLIEDDLALDDLNLNLDLGFGNRIDLGDITDAKTLDNIKQLFNEVDDVVESDANVDDARIDLKIVNNRIIVNSAYFLNRAERKIVDSFLDPENKDNLQNIASKCGGCEFEVNFPPAGCPDGYTRLATCTSTSCVESAIQRFLSASVISNGDCGEVRVQRNLLNVTVYARKC